MGNTSPFALEGDGWGKHFYPGKLRMGDGIVRVSRVCSGGLRSAQDERGYEPWRQTVVEAKRPWRNRLVD